MSDLIKLPTERVEQLRLLSRIRNKTIADLIGEYIQSQVEAGILTAQVPGFTVVRKRSRVEIEFGGPAQSFPLEGAKALAAMLRYLAKPRTSEMQSALRDIAGSLSGIGQFGLSRQGTSVKITWGAVTKTLAPSIAEELASLIEKAAE